MTRSTNNELRVVSYNCDGFINATPFINVLLKDEPDILLLQETWLLDSQANIISSINSNYISVAKSGISDTATLHKSRPSGGVAILWNKHRINNVIPLVTSSRRVSCCIINKSFMLVNVYMPCDKQLNNATNVDYQECLDEITQLIERERPLYIIIGGDFNASFDRNNVQTRTLENFIAINTLRICWNNDNACKGFTYVNENLHHKSCIDHLLFSQNLNTTCQSSSSSSFIIVNFFPLTRGC